MICPGHAGPAAGCFSNAAARHSHGTVPRDHTAHHMTAARCSQDTAGRLRSDVDTGKQRAEEAEGQIALLRRETQVHPPVVE